MSYKLTPEEALAALQDLSEEDDLEFSHSEADGVLCALLRFHGHDDIVARFNDLEKWYA